MARARAARCGPGCCLPRRKLAAPVGGWSEEPIGFALLRRADLSLKLAAHSLAYGGWRVDAPSLTAVVADGALSLQQFTGSLLGGSIEASGGASDAAEPSLQGRLALKDVDLKQALATAGGADFIDGRFDVDARLATTGRSEAALVAHLAGDAALRSEGGSIAGINLKAMHDHLGAKPGGDLAALLRSGVGGRTAFSTLEGNFRLADGVAGSDDLRFLAEDGDGRATASLDLAKWAMASRVEFRLAGLADAPPLVMRLDGPIDAPRTVFEVNALEQYLARRTEAQKPPRP